MGGFNEFFGEKTDEKEVDCYGLGNYNERGEKLINCFKNNKLFIKILALNMIRDRYMWKKPDDTNR